MDATEQTSWVGHDKRPWLSRDNAPFYHPAHWDNEATHSGYRSILAAICSSTEVSYFLRRQGAGDKIKRAADEYVRTAMNGQVPAEVREDYSSTLAYGPPSPGFDVGRKSSWHLGSLHVERLLESVDGIDLGPRWANRWGGPTFSSSTASPIAGSTTAMFTYRPPDHRRWRYNVWRATLPADRHLWVVALVLADGSRSSHFSHYDAASYVFLYDGYDELEIVPALRRVMFFDPARAKKVARSLAVDIAAARFRSVTYAHTREMKKILDTVFQEDLYTDMQLHGAFVPHKEEE